MRTYSMTDTIKLFKEREIDLFTLDDFGRLLDIKNQNTIYKKIQRLEKKAIFRKLIKGKYWFSLSRFNDFKTANFLFQPSYVSLESALSFYGIITGFSYRITSLTTNKPRSFIFDEKDFFYSHINPDFFWGYEKKEDFLIAEKEKALLDFLYFHTKGLRTLDKEEMDFSEINKKKLIVYGKRFENNKLLKIINEEIL